ncbi:homoserine O-succinyltransferase [Ruminococcaceae bacterium OttesenSCG-928-D13]|nr:homoserine O-succinyltransferase [Ruminococcaceae bacterium OttesenSCG-928-D13]
MPLILPNSLPATKVLQDENIFVMDHERAISQDIRPLEILIVNLMPDKVTTETQLARMLANSPLQVRLTLLRTGTYLGTHTPLEHIGAFYRTLDELQGKRYDGMIITGAPVEQMAFEEIDYWDELRRLLEFSRENVFSTVYLCWAAMAALYYYYDIPKVGFPQKLHGVFEHRVVRPGNPLVRGFDEIFYVPHSRHAGIDRLAVEKVPELRILAESDEAGLHLLSTENGREIYVMGHSEYDKETLYNEYQRDRAAGMNPQPPQGYFRDNDPEKDILFRWRSHGHLLYSNWLNYYVYQDTPFDLSQLKK